VSLSPPAAGEELAWGETVEDNACYCIPMRKEHVDVSNMRFHIKSYVSVVSRFSSLSLRLSSMIAVN